MKTLLVAGLGLALLLAGAGRRAAGAQLPPESEPSELRTDFHPLPYGKSDGHGRLLFQELVRDGLHAGWHSTEVYYPRGKQESVKLNRDISAINAFFAAEVYQPKTVHTFIKEYLTSFLNSVLAEDSSIITAREAEEGLGSDPRSLDPHFRKPENVRLRARMRPYACSSDPVVKGNNWTVDMNALTDEGAVEHWLVRGRVSPLRIESFLCEAKEPRGSFHPNVRVY